MAEIKPLRAWRYHDSLNDQLDALTSPLFDVVSDKHRQSLYQHPLNSIHLSVPQQPDSAKRAGALLQQWKTDGIVLQDKLPTIYVYYQYFTLAGTPRLYCRKGFICHIRTYAWEDNIILRHESTIPKAVNDRVELLVQTDLHVSPTHGLYTDPNFELERYMDEAIQNPLYETEDYQGVRDVLGIIQDADVINRFIEVIKDKNIILADGHHRYEGSLHYQQLRQEKNPLHTGDEGYNFHLMYLTNTEADDLRILPTHRLIQQLKDFDPDVIMEKLKADFDVREIEDADTIHEIIHGKKWAFGILFKDRTFKVKLKPEALATMTWRFPEEVKQLDLTILHYFIIEKVLGIPGKEQRTSEVLSFDRSFSDCLAKVIREESQMAIITQEISIEEVKRVCASGYTMPQKSTYFFPKVICGFLFSSMKEDEFASPIYSPF